MSTDAAIEQEIRDKGLSAPRITPNDIESAIAAEHYFTAAQALAALNHPVHVGLNLLTFCVIVLQNGFTVTGESACASPENFDAELGRKIARSNAIDKIWPLMGYALRDRLHNEERDQQLLHAVNEPGVPHESITLDLEPGQQIKINGLPLELASSARVTTHPGNVALIQSHLQTD